MRWFRESTEGAPGNGASIQGQSVLARVFNLVGEPEHAEQEIATAEAGNTPENPDVSLDEKDDVTVVYEKTGAGNRSEGIFRKDVNVIAPPGTCAADANTLCLSGGRFRVTALWEDPNTHVLSSARAVKLTGDTGYFWFFNADNVEVVVKALAACPINSRFWVFAAGLTNVEVALRVDDVVTGQSNNYFNTRDRAYQPILDSDAFASCGAATVPVTSLTDTEIAALRAEVLAGLLTFVGESETTRVEASNPGTAAAGLHNPATAACSTGGDSLCLTANRFRVEVDFLHREWAERSRTKR